MKSEPTHVENVSISQIDDAYTQPVNCANREFDDECDTSKLRVKSK